MTQTDRLIRYLRRNPGASSLDITLDCAIVNTTGRISDARARGLVIVCETRRDGVKGYRIVEQGEQMGLAL